MRCLSARQELEIFFLRIGRPRRGVRSLNSPEMSEARNFGSKLYDAVFQGGVQACLLRSLAATGNRACAFACACRRR